MEHEKTSPRPSLPNGRPAKNPLSSDPSTMRAAGRARQVVKPVLPISVSSLAATLLLPALAP